MQNKVPRICDHVLMNGHTQSGIYDFVQTPSGEIIIQHTTLGIPGELKNAISVSFAFNILIGNENVTSEEHKTKNRLK